MISLLTLDVEHVVGEVVILVDNEIEFEVQIMRDTMDQVEHTHTRLLLFHILQEVIGIVDGVFLGKQQTALAQIAIEVLIEVIQITAHHREVAVQHLKLALLRCGMIGDIKALEQLLEVVLLIDVVVGLQHVEEQALAEAARTDEEKKVAGILHPFEEHGLVNQIFMFFSYLLEVGNAVRYALEIRAHNVTLLYSSANITKRSGT